MIANTRIRSPLGRPGLVLFAFLIASLGFYCSTSQANVEEKQKEYFQKPGANVSDILRARGFEAEVHNFVTDDGYVLAITRGMNPLISRSKSKRLLREPLLFIHGTLVDGNSFVMNSFDVEKAQDFSGIDANQLSEKELIRLFKDEPSAKALAFFALNFGHEVWFLHRRGAPLSQRRVELTPDQEKPPTVMEKYLMAVRDSKRRKHHSHGRRKCFGQPPNANQTNGGRSTKTSRSIVARSLAMLNKQKSKSAGNKTEKSNSKVAEAVEAAPAALLDYGNLVVDIERSMDKRLWNHSFDEQAAYDLPNAVDYVLEVTGHERLALVGDSSGGSLILQTLVLEPKLDNKLSKAIAWLPSFNIGHNQDGTKFNLLQPIFDYIGPFPFTFVSHPVQALGEIACSMEIMQLTLCSLALDANWGSSQGQAPLRPEFQSAYMTPVSAHEYLQLIQYMTRKQTRMFNFRNKTKNLMAYGREDPPYYNVSLISYEHLSIYVGTSDTLVNQEDVDSVHRELTVPHTIRTLDQKGVNHGAALFHKDIATIVTIPTYKDIISNGYRRHNSRRHGTRSQSVQDH